MNNLLKQKREEKGYTIEDMAKIIEKSAPNYSMKENGKVKFTVYEALLIADFLNEKVETLFSKESYIK